MPRAKRTPPRPAGRDDFAAHVEATKTSAREQLLSTVADARVRSWLSKLLGVLEGNPAEVAEPRNRGQA